MVPRITGDGTLDLIVVALGIFGWVVLFKIVYAAREGVAWWGGALVRGLIGFALAAAVAPSLGFKGSDATVAAYIVAGLAVATAKPRSRHISAKVRRKVIERDLKGQKYDPKKHHVDHVWPYSRGGSSTEDNLRVLDKRENLKKGAKKPRIKDLF